MVQSMVASAEHVRNPLGLDAVTKKSSEKEKGLPIDFFTIFDELATTAKD